MPVSQKSVLLLGWGYPPQIGGVETSLKALAQAATAKDWLPLVVSSDAGLMNTQANRRYQDADGTLITRYPLRPFTWLGPLNTFCSLYIAFCLLRRIRVTYPEIIVISRYHLLTVLASLAGFRNIRYLIPSLVYVLNSTTYTHTPAVKIPFLFIKIKIYSLIQRLALYLSQPFVFSELARNQCRALIKSSTQEIGVVKPGIDPSRFYLRDSRETSEVRSSLGLPTEKKLVLFVGRFIAAKGLEVLIKSLKYLSKDTHLVLVGEGVLEQQLCSLMASEGLAGRVHIIPPMSDVELIYGCCNVFAMSSNNETLGQTILEASASGLPIAAFSKKAGVKTATEELSLNDFIAYADFYSPKHFAAALELQMAVSRSKKARQSAMTHHLYSWDKLLEALSSDR